jgi:hypothetical protein
VGTDRQFLLKRRPPLSGFFVRVAGKGLIGAAMEENESVRRGRAGRVHAQLYGKSIYLLRDRSINARTFALTPKALTEGSRDAAAGTTWLARSDIGFPLVRKCMSLKWTIAILMFFHLPPSWGAASISVSIYKVFLVYTYATYREASKADLAGPEARSGGPRRR